MSRTTLWAAGLIVLIAAAIYFTSGTREAARTAPDGQAAATVIDLPLVMFRTLSPTDMFGRIAMVRASAPHSTRFVSPLSCARVAHASGNGVCLVEESSGPSVTHAAYLFDRSFTRASRIDLSGIPTRARVSPDGRRAAITVYGEEHAPNGEERLAISSLIVDTAAGRMIADLRELTIDPTGAPDISGPLDFSSVAFARDSNRFFATMSTTSERYIVAGVIDQRRLTVLASGLANEALSPDETRLIVKKRVGDRGYWQLLVFDLATTNSVPLNQGGRSVDDQVEWLDETHVVYHDATDQGTNLWMLATDGVSAPRLLIRDAYSPSIPH